MECVTDHSTADCPMVRVPRELLERAAGILDDHGSRTADEFRAQLAAIQGGIGEVPAASQYRIGVNGEWLYSSDREYLQRERDEYESQCEPGDCEHETPEPIYSLADVQRITAAMAAEVADAKSARDAYGQNAIDLQKQRGALRAEVERLRDQASAMSAGEQTMQEITRPCPSCSGRVTPEPRVCALCLGRGVVPVERQQHRPRRRPSGEYECCCGAVRDADEGSECPNL